MPSKKLIIVESPTKAKTISKFLGTDCRIIASNGHIRTLPKEGICIDIKNGYEPEYIEDPSKIKVISELKSELKNADELILATDEDREGESISWHLVQVLKPQVPFRRMVFHEITKKAIKEAFENGRELDMNLVYAQEARRVLDRVYGYTISPVLWSKLSNKSLSAGRVQSPGLRLIVDREKLRLSYKKSEYWEVKAFFDKGLTAQLDSYNSKKIATGKDFSSETGEYVGSPKTMLLSFESAKVLIDELKSGSFTISDIKEKTVIQHPAPPFTTSTLQQEGNRKLHLSAKDTMKIAQSLYENGYITYMRTDSTALSEEGTLAARKAAQSLCGSEYLADTARRYETKDEYAQEAHEAIRPAGDVFRLPEETGLSGKELSLYKMIFNRTLACQMRDAVKLNTTVAITAQNGDNTGIFTVSGTRIEFPGFIRIYVEGSDDPESALAEKDVIIPKLSVGDLLSLKNMESGSHETKAPSRYTEASLVQELEKRGIGRPSTYAAIIDRILEKHYVIRENGALVPSFTGFGVVNLLEGYFENRIDYEFTSQMEGDLDKISQGKLNKLDYLKNFYEGKTGLQQQIKDVKNKIDSKTVKMISLPHIKPENTVILGPYGPYIKTESGKYVSIPDLWTPASVTDEMIENLKNGSNVFGNGSTPPAVVGQTPDGKPVLYCTGRFGDYWQIGNKAETNDVKRFKVPSDLKGKTVSVDLILQLFNLPKKIGSDENGNEIIADIGRYGAYLKCKDDYRNFKSCEELLQVTESEAKKIFSSPKPVARHTASKVSKKNFRKKSSGSGSATISDPSNIVKNFGEYEGQILAIRSGRYGFYLKHGETNYRIPANYQHDEEACKNMTPVEALDIIKK